MYYSELSELFHDLIPF